jgi:hypothetical protein
MSDSLDYSNRSIYRFASSAALECTLQHLQVTDLWIDGEYQRPVDSANFARKLAAMRQGDRTFLGLAALRADGRFWVVDGQHHVLAARACGLTNLPFLVFTSAGAQIEAFWFDRWNEYQSAREEAGCSDG